MLAGMESEGFWIGFPVVSVEGLKYAVTQILKWGDGTYTLRMRRGWEDRFLQITESDYPQLFGPDVNPQMKFHLQTRVPDQPTPELYIAARPEQCWRCGLDTIVDEALLEEDPSTIEHSEECLAMGGSDCVEGCPVAEWYDRHPEAREQQ